MQYDTGKHCVFHHRYHLVWSTKYRFKVLTGQVRLRVRDICRQVCPDNEVDICAECCRAIKFTCSCRCRQSWPSRIWCAR